MLKYLMVAYLLLGIPFYARVLLFTSAKTNISAFAMGTAIPLLAVACFTLLSIVIDYRPFLDAPGFPLVMSIIVMFTCPLFLWQLSIKALSDPWKISCIIMVFVGIGMDFTRLFTT